nr:ribonuclease H-like domain-containing protein [Tanacetum cinerariifolium]
MAMLSVRVHKFKQKAGRKIDFDKKESARFNKKKVICYKCQQRGHFTKECKAKGGNDKKRYSSFKIKEIGKKEEDSKALITIDTLVDWTDHDGESDGVIVSKEFGMIDGCDTEDAIEEGIPLFNKFFKADSMKVMPPPLFEDYTSLSDHIDLGESQMSYSIKSSTSRDFKSVSNDFVSCDDSDKSSEVNTNDFASSDSSVKSLEPKPNDSTSCASTSSVSTYENEAKIESNVGTPIQEPIIVYDLPSFSYNSSDKNENTSRTSCNKNGYFNKKAGHFRKNASSVSKLCFVCESGTHLIKDCDFYEKQMVNKTVDIGVGPVYSKNKVNHQNQFIPQAVLLRTGKVNIPPARPQLVPTSKPKVFAPVPTGRQNRPFPVPIDRGYSPLVISGWWKSSARHMPDFSRPTSYYFQPYTTYVPTMYYNHMKYGEDRWATAVKPLAGCSWKSHRKENPFLDAKDEGVFDSCYSRSMTGRITGKETIRTPTLDFENVYYVKELQQFNLFSISQICDKKNRVLFTDTECLVLSKDCELPDESMVVLRVPRKHNLYTINLNNLCSRGNLACLVAHASVDESV